MSKYYLSIIFLVNACAAADFCASVGINGILMQLNRIRGEYLRENVLHSHFILFYFVPSKHYCGYSQNKFSLYYSLINPEWQFSLLSLCSVINHLQSFSYLEFKCISVLQKMKTFNPELSLWSKCNSIVFQAKRFYVQAVRNWRVTFLNQAFYLWSSAIVYLHRKRNAVNYIEYH